MRLVPYVFFHARLLIQVRVVNRLAGIFWVLLITICFLILYIMHIFKRKALYLLLIPIENNSLVKGFRCQAIFHPADDLKFIVVDLADVRDSCRGPPLVFLLILFDKRASYLVEFVLILICQMHIMNVLEGVYVVAHHFWQSFSLLDGFLIEFHQVVQTSIIFRVFVILF